VITQLTATNFRNLAPLELSFGAPVTAFVGENAQGKTNLLEAISVLALGKSLRASSDTQLIAHGQEFFRITAELADGTQLAVAQDANEKKCQINGKQVPVRELLGRLPVVSFWPEDLNLVLLAPAKRRRYLDTVLSQVNPAYLQASLEYARILKQRNALLSQIAEGRSTASELDFWDAELARHGTVIGRARADFIAAIAIELQARFEDLAHEAKNLTARLSGFRAEELDEAKYLENLTKLRDKDLKYESTNYGPHRQDLIFELDDEPVADNGSRGEIRSTLLALKFAELQFLEAQLGQKPLLLLDDVFSELDRGRQERLMTGIAGYQTLITTTKLEHVDGIAGEKQIFEVAAGTVNLQI